jgi:parallel beta-helix repeat protein
MKRSGLQLALLLALPVAASAVAPAHAATKISSFGYVINAPGTYQVTQDLSGPGTAITVLASNVDLHLGGHTLTGDFTGAGVDVEGGANVSIENGTVRRFGNGIQVLGAFDCKVTNVTASQNSNNGIAAAGGAFRLTVTSNTASGNGGQGILLSGASANTVTRNTADDNGLIGIDLESASGNTLDHNTTDRNGNLGILLLGNSNGNTVTRNSATGNGNGIALGGGAAQNTIQSNAVSGNGQIGIGIGDGGTSSNTVQGNTATLNRIGIWVGNGAGGNTLQGNTALDSGDVDLEDQNFACDSDAWSNNKFVTDRVAGGPDGGPNSGCIR